MWSVLSHITTLVSRNTTIKIRGPEAVPPALEFMPVWRIQWAFFRVSVVNINFTAFSNAAISARTSASGLSR